MMLRRICHEIRLPAADHSGGELSLVRPASAIPDLKSTVK